ncbi:hypothetical protein O6H91_15G017800 [Diphasiastrum complanatum]|uniref:Uncharacterized protein n=1 Tax=Diphasiastrum complanatum TaxID=34168 RepID=A0ACC2BGE1_DIPCM|nr:hypothetical protein O6H91_15G017800 [Diphasiastrum complanatum]
MARKGKERASRHPVSTEKNSTRQTRELRLKLDDNADMLYDILKHLDGRTLAVAACVNRKWRKAAQDESLWEGVCTMNRSVGSYQASQLRSVILALGGFKRLYVLCLRKPITTQSSNRAICISSFSSLLQSRREWSNNEVHLSLSLSLFSIDCYERLGRRRYGPFSISFQCKPSLHCVGAACQSLNEVREIPADMKLASV